LLAAASKPDLWQNKAAHDQTDANAQLGRLWQAHLAPGLLDREGATAPIPARWAHAILRGMTRPFQVPRLSLRAALLLSLVVIIVTQAVLYAMGHPLICKCGYVELWHGTRGDSGQSQHIADWYTYSHVLHGVIFYWLITYFARGHLSVAARLLIAVCIEGAWEIFENTPLIINRYRTATLSRDYFGDSLVNSAADMVAMIIGFLLAARLPAWVTIALIIVVEGALLYLIRDNLLLNIIMLVYPIDAIKLWQAGG
jgi:hypothetical protein